MTMDITLGAISSVEKNITMEMDLEAKGLKLGHKFVKLWRKIVQSKRSQDLNVQEEGQVHCLQTGHSETSRTRSNLLGRTKRHILRRFSSRRIGFVEDIEKKSGNPPKDVPKGFVAIYVGDSQEEQTRFVIPVFYFNHPLFLHLLEETEQVYGFNQKGVFTIPCQVSDFEYLQWLIDREHAQDSTR